jgi:hypothetical protein
MSGWRKIETAPEDDLILVCDEWGQQVACKFDDCWWVVIRHNCTDEERIAINTPSYWRPLPKLPKDCEQ